MNTKLGLAPLSQFEDWLLYEESNDPYKELKAHMEAIHPKV